MRAKEPVAEVNNVDILLHKDVARERPVPHPVAQAMLVRAGGRVGVFFRGRGVVTAKNGADLAQCAALDLLCDGCNGCRISALEPYVYTLRGLHTLANLESLPRLVHVNAHRFLAIDVLARRHGRFQVLHVKEGRRRNLNQIHILRGCELLKRARPMKEQFFCNGLGAAACVDLAKVLAGYSQSIWKQVSQRDDLRGSVFGERSSHRSAPASATQQAEPDSGIGLIAECRAWLKQQQTGSRRRSGRNKFPTFHNSSFPCECYSAKSPAGLLSAHHFAKHPLEICLFLLDIFNLLRP